jgi:hypothetical protein
MIFITNKYTIWYNSIIANAKARTLVDEYTERHHIIPKSLGGDNSKENLVKLTAREHFICHWLLIKMISNKVLLHKMQFALNSFRRTSKNQHRHILSSRQYETVRKQVSIARSQSQLGNTFALGFKQSPETIAKRVAKVTGMKKKKWSAGQCKRLSDATKGKPKPLGFAEQVSARRKGMPSPLKGRKVGPYPEERKQKLRIPKKKLTCPHCNKEGGSSNMKRYHFNNCKSLIV